MISSLETNNTAIVHEAQQVHTEVYLAKGFISEEQLNEEHLYVDEYTDRSETILIKTGNKETTIRIIHTDKNQGLLSLPTAKNFSVDPEVVKSVAHVSRLSALKQRDVVEISGLASMKIDSETSAADVFDATRQAYATGLRRSLDQGHKLWIMNIDERLNQSLKMILGKDSLHDAGEEKQYIGPPTKPVVLNPQDIVTSILKGSNTRFSEMNKKDIRKSLSGVSEKYLPTNLVKLLHENGISTEKDSVFSRILKRKKAIGYTAIIGYSTVRAIPVAAIPEFYGNPFIFAGIDIGTAFTQVWGTEKYLTGKTRTIRALGAVTAVASLMAPYGYVWLNGRDYPAYVNIIAGGLIGLAVAKETVMTIKDRKLHDGLQ